MDPRDDSDLPVVEYKLAAAPLSRGAKSKRFVGIVSAGVLGAIVVWCLHQQGTTGRNYLDAAAVAFIGAIICLLVGIGWIR